MLDTDTKRRIDTARDILVGKVPDPKSQVEQITIALIYKFMDDMDAEAEELGGKRKFFTGEFARYGWAKLMSKGLGGHELIALYGEGIGAMPENPGIPVLFRDIFKNAYLPYRDPETLKSFLKIINEFSYDHSERLGDAFEYLLSVLGSQGDAGQFRTPRHIIDFIVEILAPQKGETILDPACGTAGFLISAYKHILRSNSSPRPQAGEGTSTPFALSQSKGKNGMQASTGSARTGRVGDLLTPEEKGQLAQNFKGYDISPDMVRLSLVNLYLHGFTDPHIVEYDTLTSEKRWNEYADVILANPPFMSPKGGIKPHKRFSIQAKRSEVLFVDYMAEHLTPTGRAGIIVPEGIIFQSQTAYKELRKMLVENSLVAVISLPAGCFNPYSGVKTSILILDKSIAKQSNSIAFFKVENDGYGLGAQRRANAGEQLTQVQAELAEYLKALRNRQTTDDLQPMLGLIVPKEKIAANGDYNLNGERYREGVAQSTHFPWRKIESLVETVTPPAKIQKTAFGAAGRFPIIDQSQDDIAGWTDDESALVRPSKPLVIFGDHTCAIKLVETPFAQGADGIKILQTIDALDPRFLFHVLRARPMESDGYQRHYSKLKEHQIPLPPLEVQKEIVAEIEGYQKVINGARAVLDNYRPHIPVHPDWPIIELSEICSFKNGLNFDKTSSGYSIKIIGVSDFQANLYAPLDNLDEVHLSAPLGEDYLVKAGDILFVRSNGNPDLVGRSLFVPPPREPTTFSGFTIRGRIHDERALPLFFALFFKSRDFAEMVKTVGRGANIRNLSQGILNELKIPLPPLSSQQAIVAEIEAEQALVAANRELIARFEKKIQATL
ncbi:MAG: N-6 DNA methylase, partial [Candidatus Nitrotoga sp.]